MTRFPPLHYRVDGLRYSQSSVVYQVLACINSLHDNPLTFAAKPELTFFTASNNINRNPLTMQTPEGHMKIEELSTSLKLTRTPKGHQNI